MQRSTSSRRECPPIKDVPFTYVSSREVTYGTLRRSSGIFNPTPNARYKFAKVRFYLGHRCVGMTSSRVSLLLAWSISFFVLWSKLSVSTKRDMRQKTSSRSFWLAWSVVAGHWPEDDSWAILDGRKLNVGRDLHYADCQDSRTSCSNTTVDLERALSEFCPEFGTSTAAKREMNKASHGVARSSWAERQDCRHTWQPSHPTTRKRRWTAVDCGVGSSDRPIRQGDAG